MMPAGEIAALTAVCIIVCAGFVYLVFKCCKSMVKLNKDSNQPRKTFPVYAPNKLRSFQQWSGKAVPTQQVIGQGYPQRVTIATVDDLIKEKSDLHPQYMYSTSHDFTDSQTQGGLYDTPTQQRSLAGMTRSPGYHEGLAHATNVPEYSSGGIGPQVSSVFSNYGYDSSPVKQTFRSDRQDPYQDSSNVIVHMDFSQDSDRTPLHRHGTSQEPHLEEIVHSQSVSDTASYGPHVDTYI